MKYLYGLTICLVGSLMVVGCSSGKSASDTEIQKNFSSHQMGTPPPPGAFKPKGPAFIGKPSGPVGAKNAPTAEPPGAAAGPGK